MITELQRDRRRQHLGSSDAPALVIDPTTNRPLSPWRTPSDVYAEKVFEVADEPTPAKATGNRMEAAILAFAAERLGKPINLSNRFRVDNNGTGGVLACNVDAWLGEPGLAIVEAKYVGPNSTSEWGEDGSDQVPDHVLVQVQHQLYVTCAGVCHVAAAVAGFAGIDWRIYPIEPRQRLMEAIVEQEMRFWRDHVITRTPPDSYAPALTVLKQLRREPAKSVTIDPAIVEAWLAAKGTASVASKNADQAQAALLEALGDAEAGDLPDGRRITYLESKRKGYTVESSTYRSLRLVTPKL